MVCWLSKQTNKSPKINKWQKTDRILTSNVPALFLIVLWIMLKGDTIKKTLGADFLSLLLSFANYLSTKLWKHPCRTLRVYVCDLQFVLRSGWRLYPWGRSRCQSGRTSGYLPEQWIHCCHRARGRKQNIFLKFFVMLTHDVPKSGIPAVCAVEAARYSCPFKCEID